MTPRHIVADYLEAVATEATMPKSAADRLTQLEAAYDRVRAVGAHDLLMEAHKRARLLMTTMRCSMREAQLAVAEELRRADEDQLSEVTT